MYNDKIEDYVVQFSLVIPPNFADLIDWAIIAARWDIQSWVLAGVLWVSESYC